MGVGRQQAVDSVKMPGHIKKTSGPDPDPSPWLEVKDHIREAQKKKAYDPKKSVWVPNPAKDVGGYFEGISEEEIKYDTFTAGKKLTVNVNGENKTYKADTVCQVNPPKFDNSEDMADLTFLGDACVLWNSVVRYKNELIYTYSGLFCIAINPYKRFPIYTLRTMEIYIGKRRSECWPHIFAIAEGAYQGMMTSGCNQSILITGESGAGKTENTKKVISYFATICSSGKRKEGEASLEDKIVATNPVLEAWGNAKTVRNDNSSRFGKFIRIHFNQSGKLSGADMVVYLLEKSRLTYQQPLERCYHSFYNMMPDAVPDLKEKCLLSNEILDYWYVSQGKLTVPSIDDKEDMQFAHEAFVSLGFSEQQEYDVYKNTACMMHMGNMTKDFVPVGKEEQAEIKDYSNAEKVAQLLGIDCEWMVTYFCKPKLKVGTEWVQKGSSCTGAGNSVSGIARAIYERTFRIVVDKCNETLIDPTMKKVQYIGVLDIAGFEIFDYNGFEQICINYVNEKLQQFFNQHMFTPEQEEYVREGLDWSNVDFGVDLQPCIDMFEKPMCFLAIFEEESLFPKATDETFKAKLHENLLGKRPNFTKYKMMSTDLENMREKLENEAMRKSDALKALSKSQAEIQLWKSRLETEGMGRIEELEGARNKLQSKIVENEELVDVLSTKVANAEKSKGRLATDLDDISMEYERVHAAALITEKRAKNFDKVLGEWQSKAADLAAEIGASQDEGRNYSSELFRLKAAQQESVEQLDVVKRENKNLADEIKDLLDQLGEGGRSIHALDKQRRMLEQEKEELQGALEEAEATLEMEENRVLRSQLELANVRQEIDRRVAEKEE